MRGGFGCSPCCGPQCDPCTATCTEPHTGTAFETVYTRFFEGVQAGNTTDGYLTATGDSDTSDPYNGMDGTGPWYQQVGGGFQLGGDAAGTRFPCSVRVSFWRSSYTLGASTIPPASTALTKNVITVSVSQGALVTPSGVVITPSDGVVEVSSVPLVTGTGDQSSADPRFGEGTVSFSSRCWNETTVFSIQGRIEWNTQKRQHILYGIVRECYDTPDPDNPGVTSCDTFCDGDPPPSVVYLTISGLSSLTATAPWTGTVANLSLINGTYAIDPFARDSGVCDQYLSVYTNPSPCDSPLSTFGAGVNIDNGFGIFSQPFASTWIGGYWFYNGKCFILAIGCKLGKANVCSGESGTGDIRLFELPYVGGGYQGSFSWTLSP